MKFFFGFAYGFIIFTLLEPFVINLVYMKNIALFLDLILSEKQKNKLITYIKNKYF